MNQIYKVIWSKVKHQYVVTSEFAHSCTKSTGRMLGRRAAAVLAAFILTAGVGVVPVWAVNTADATTAIIDGNYSAYLDAENTIDSSENSYVIGDGNTIKNFDNTFVLGNNNNLYPNYSGAGVGSSDTIVIGNDNNVNMNFGNGLLVGNNNTVTGGNSGTLAFGNGVELGSSRNSVILGNEAKSSGTGSVIIGYGAEGIASGNVVIGEGASSTGSGTGNSIAIGQNASVTGTEAVAIGYGAENHDGYGAAIGAFSKVGDGSYGLAIGGYSEVGENAQNSIAIGTSGRGYGEGSTRVGKDASWSIAMGAGVSVGDKAQQSIAIGGYGTSVGSSASYSTALGTYATVEKGITQATAIGYSANGNGIKGTALGAYSDVIGEEGTASGYKASASADYSTAYGARSASNAVGSTALGYNSSVEEGADNSVAVGSGSKVIADNILNDDEVEAFLTGLGDYAYRDFNIMSGDTNGVFSVGSKGGERRIINVARGRISADSTDAINGSQLYGAVQYLDGRIDVLENTMGGGGEILPDDDNVTIKHPDGETTTGGAGTGGTEETTPGGSDTGSGEGGTGTGAGGSTPTDNTHYVGLNEDVVLGDTMEDGSFNSGSLTVQKDADGNAITINKEDENGVGDGLVSGLNNTDWDWNKYEQGGYATSNAATEAQLHGAMEGTVQYDRDEQGNVDKTNITLNPGGQSVTIHNVAAGTADTDAVNVSQLNEAWDQINNNTTAITNIGNKVGELDSRIDEVGAGAAALAALHPLDFDPDDKWDFAAGYGNYRGENAVAIGAFYRPNEDTMFSVGGTVGNDDNMVNAGVSFKIGQGNGVSTSRVAMAKEIKDLRKELEAMKSAMLDVNAGRKLDTSKLQLFPDVPQNHWAYEYVATLAGNGVIEGYPDGNFDGARPMTRYEFAAMLYRAMLNGAKLSDKILTEFAPELERFTVDVVHKDSDGNPTVERVRVVKRNDTAK